MRAFALAVAIMLPLAPAALAAPKEDRAAQSGARYFLLTGSLVGEVETDAFLREERRGGTVTSATLDVCYGSPNVTNRRDRFVIDLKPRGNTLVGTGRTLVRSEPIDVQLIRQPDGDKVTFEGTIKIAGKPFEVSSPDNGDVSEQEFREGQQTEEFIFTSPSVFAEPGPGTVGVRVKVEGLAHLVQALKGEDVRVRVETLQTDCAALRNGNQVVQMEVDPMRSAALVDKLKGLPGVLRAGWTAGNYSLESAVRLPRADFGGASLDRDRLINAIAASAAKAWSASVEGVTRDDLTGEVTVKLKRPSEAYGALGLSEIIGLPFIIGPERLDSTEALVVWLGVASLENVDQGPEPRLKVVKLPEGLPGADNVDTAVVLETIARDLHGRVWDNDAGKWK